MKLSNKATLSLYSLSNAHLRLVNSAFASFVSLKLALVIQLLTKNGAAQQTCWTTPSFNLKNSLHLFFLHSLVDNIGECECSHSHNTVANLIAILFYEIFWYPPAKSCKNAVPQACANSGI